MASPIPKRSTERRRRNAVPGLEFAPASSADYKPPAASRDWHPAARRWFRDLRASGQSRFYEPSDWSVAWLLAERMSRLLFDDAPNAAGWAAVDSGMSRLLATEGDRRRLRLELVREDEVAMSEDDRADATVSDIRARLSGA